MNIFNRLCRRLMFRPAAAIFLISLNNIRRRTHAACHFLSLRFLSLSAMFCFLVFFSAPAAAKTITLLADGDTSAWQYKTFDNIPPTKYKTIDDETLARPVLFADSRQGASGYIREIAMTLQHSPWLHFQWRVDKAAAGFLQREKSGDDFAFRLYFIGVAGIVGSQGVALVRANSKIGETWKSPYNVWQHDLRFYVFAGDDAPVGEWRRESINLNALWQQLHGEPPPDIRLIGLMSDSDSTGTVMQARYGGVVLSNSAENPF